jgi:YVTN family beta-propeller protein
MLVGRTQKFLLTVAACVAAFWGSIAIAAAAGTGYHVVKKIPLKNDDGGFDYSIVDSIGRRLYVSHSTHVVVLDADSGEVVGSIPNTDGVHGIAPAPDLGRGFTSNGRAGTVTIFDLKTLQKVGEAKTGKNPDAILYDPATKRVFAFNGDSDSTTVINGADGSVAGTIELGGAPESGASDGAGMVWVNLEDKSMVVQLDPKQMTVKARWPLAPCESPTGMAMDKKTRRLYVGCRNNMMAVMNADTGKVVATPAICTGTDASAFDPEASLVFHSCSDGTISVYHEDSPDKYTLVDTIKTQQGSRTMALDLKTHRIFQASNEFGPTPAPTADQPRPRAPVLPGGFAILVVDK